MTSFNQKEHVRCSQCGRFLPIKAFREHPVYNNRLDDFCTYCLEQPDRYFFPRKQRI